MSILNNYQNSIYTNVFITPLSWCNVWNNFCTSDIDIGYVCNRKKTLEPLGLESNGILFSQEVKI